MPHSISKTVVTTFVKGLRKGLRKTLVKTFARRFRKTLAQAMLWRKQSCGASNAAAPRHAQAQIYAQSPRSRC